MPRLSVLLPPTSPPKLLVAEARALESAGLDGAWIPDHLAGGSHFSGGPWFAAVPTLTALAAGTASLHCGTLVASLCVQPPELLALEFATLAALAPGRIRAGIGTGAHSDAARTGLVVPPPSVLVATARRITAAGVPVLVAGNVPASVEAAAAAGGGWATTGGLGRSAHAKLDRIRTLRRIWETAGGTGPTLVLVEPPEASPWTSDAQMAATLRRWADEGFDEVAIFPPEVYAASFSALGYAEAAAIRDAA